MGLCVLVGFAGADGEAEATRFARKVAALRIFEDESGRMNLDVREAGGAALVVSQFTLVADTKRQRGTRPDFSKAAPRDVAERLYELFVDELRRHGVPTETGLFGARMQVELVNDGPVTIILET